jgi:two-component system CheB/CheR fusion protein
VVVGSSAGGIDALLTFVAGLDPAIPAAVVVAQHLDPARRSVLKEILQRKARLPVVLLAGRTPLAPGHVYVVPAGSNVVVNPGLADLRSDPAGTHSHPSVDVLLTSAAKAYADRLFAVILTGNGSDGANGAVAVKQAGGTVIIQDPASASHPSMPRALPPTAVDHVAAIEDIAGLLGDLVGRAAENRAREDAIEGQLADIIGIVGGRSNIDFRPYKASTVLRRIERRMAVVRAANLKDYALHLEAHPEESSALVKALLIKVTEFFRDPEAFQFLHASVLPGVVERARGQDHRLRLWSAGCATGEEAYSLAMIVADLIGTELAAWSLRVFATDLNEEAVEFARRGVYPAAMLANVPEEYRARFFERVDSGSFRVTKALRQMVIYGQQDLSRGVPFPRIDLVVCRNLLIYFQPNMQADLLDLFAYSLQATGGFLFLGKAETARPSSASFALVNKKWKIYRCLSGPTAATFRPASSLSIGRTRRGPALAAASLQEDVPVPGRGYDEGIVRSMQIGAVVIDAQYRTVAVNAAARRLLGLREHGPDRDFLHSVRGIPYAEARTAIDTAMRDAKPVVLPDVSLGLGDSAEQRFVTLTIAPVAGEGSRVDHLVVTATDATETVQTRHRLEAAEAAQKRLVDELTATNLRLNEANKDLVDANEELQAANEELMLAQEELQATNEEFEATNEELQATNEELETNNEELQATNEELDTTNEELHARTVDLQDTADRMEEERERMKEIIRKAPIPVLILRGPALTVETSNPLFASIAGAPVEEGRPFDEALAGLPEIVSGVRNALQNAAAWISPPVARGDGGAKQAIVFTAVPLLDSEKEAGVAIYAHAVGGGDWPVNGAAD